MSTVVPEFVKMDLLNVNVTVRMELIWQIGIKPNQLFFLVLRITASMLLVLMENVKIRSRNTNVFVTKDIKLMKLSKDTASISTNVPFRTAATMEYAETRLAVSNATATTDTPNSMSNVSIIVIQKGNVASVLVKILESISNVNVLLAPDMTRNKINVSILTNVK